MERAVVEYLANAIWQVPLLVGAVAALLWALGADVRTRHRVWLAVLAVALLMPLRGMAPEAPEEGSVIFSPSAVPVPMGAPHGAQRTAPAADVDFSVPPVEIHKPAHKAGFVLGPVTTRWVVRFYIAISLFAGWRILRAWIAAQALLRRSRSIDLAPRAMAIFAQVANAQNVPLPRLRQSDETVSPVVIGAARPVLLLPAGFDGLKDDEIRAALSHEFAHLARRDYLINLLCQVFALPLAWHPAIHYVQKRIRDTREMLCDAVAAEEMASPVRYATCLVAFALRALDGHDGALATQGVSMFDNRILEERIAQLTQAPEQPEPATRLARLAGATAGLAVAVAMALLIHITPTWAESVGAETAVGPEAAPVQLTPPVELPALTAPASPEAPPAPAAAPAAPAAPAAVSKPRHVHVADDDTKRAIAEEEKQRAERKRDQDQFARDEAQRQRDEVQRQRDETQRQREAAHEQADRQREVGQLQREEAQRQREAAREQAEQQRETQRELQRQVAEQQREAMREAAQQQREAIEEARRGAVEASRAYAGEIKRQVAEALKAGQSVQDVDMEKIKLEIAQATSAVHTPEFKAQMAQLQNHIQQLHDNMAELRNQMKALNHEVEKVD